MNHTKGPWSFDGHGINDSEGNRICKVTNVERYDLMAKPVVLDKEFKANSLLIASAPELLESLKSLHDILSAFRGDRIPIKDKGINESINKAQSLINKVEGQ